jgi:hypothetical protein
MKKLPLFLFLFFAAIVPAFSQPINIDSTFHVIESLFESGAYMNVEVEARRCAEQPMISDSGRCIAEKWIAFSLVAQGKPSMALDHFSVVLALNPQFELDPVLTSPKILAVFDEAKARANAGRKFSADTVAVPPSNPAPEISFRTIVFPGWEQLHEHRTTSGYLFLGGGAAALGAGIVCETLRSSARSNYLSATTPPAIQSNYSTYNKYYKAGEYALSAFALVYIASEIDVFTGIHSASVSFAPENSFARSTSLALNIKF